MCACEKIDLKVSHYLAKVLTKVCGLLFSCRDYLLVLPMQLPDYYLTDRQADR